jgi:peptidoglycan hydrolase CwlO-like protein
VLRRSLAALSLSLIVSATSVLVPVAHTAAAAPTPPKEAVDPVAELAELNEDLETADAEIAQLVTDTEALDAKIDKATAKVEATAKKIDTTKTEIVVLREEVRARAVAAYVGGGTETSFIDALSGTDPNEALARVLYLQIQAKSDAELSDQLDDAIDDLVELKEKETNRRSAERKQRAALVTKTDELRTARAARAKDVADLKAIIEKVQPAGTGTGGIELCTVEGTQVACSVGPKFAAMVSDARLDGVDLTGGGGYRSPEGQIAVRKSNCGTSDYAIYEMPASSCSPPTARPGSSQHEVGLAIDFVNCSTRQTACYQWLDLHAKSYGYFNLPSEAWHWSTTGS